jgi:hypothetical protein
LIRDYEKNWNLVTPIRFYKLCFFIGKISLGVPLSIKHAAKFRAEPVSISWKPGPSNSSGFLKRPYLYKALDAVYNELYAQKNKEGAAAGKYDFLKNPAEELSPFIRECGEEVQPYEIADKVQCGE